MGDLMRMKLCVTLLTGTMLSLSTMPSAFAKGSSYPQTSVHSINVAAGSLTTALNSLAAQTGLQIIFDAKLADGKTTAGVSGTLNAQQALLALLAGSGLRSRFTSANSVTIDGPQTGAFAANAATVPGSLQLETIDVNGVSETAWGPVNGYVATRSATGSKTDSPLIETPASISVITRDQIQAQAAQNIMEVARYSSGVRTETSGADARFNYVYVRGFLADLYLDGLKAYTSGFSTSVIEPYNLERVEILHGPASVLYGQASPGGLIDMVSKRPTETPYHEIFFSTGSYGRVQGGVDLSGPIDADKHWLYRLTASGFDTGDQLQYSRYNRVSVAPALTWKPDGDTTVTLLGTYQIDPKAGFFNQLPGGGYGTLSPLPNGTYIPTSLYPGVPSVDHMRRELTQIGYQAEHRFDDIWSVRQNLRYSSVNSSIATIYPTGVSTTDPNAIGRAGFFENDHLNVFDVDSQLLAKFNVGPLANNALLGVDFQSGNYGYLSGGPSSGVTVPALSVVYPNYNTYIPMTATSRNVQHFQQVGIYGQDEIKFDHIVALLGLRWDHAQSDTVTQVLATGVGSASKLDNDALTKRGALLYKFDNGISPYIQYTESFQPQTGTSFSGSAFVPTRGQQEEAGVKYQPNAKSLYTVAFFNLQQQNVLTSDLTHVGFNVQTGAIRSRGIEFEGKTELTENISLIGSYTYLDQAITSSNVAYQTGRRPVGIPRNAAALWADYTFHSGPLDGFGMSGGVRYTGNTAGNISGTTVLTVPSATVFDAAIHYDLAGLSPRLKGLSAQVNVSNLFDKTYVSLCQDNGCWYGLRREVIATLRYRW